MNDRIDLNADLGEGFPNDLRLLALISSTGVSCGAHAGDRETMLATLSGARSNGVVVGSHPGYADREGFGRRPQKLNSDDVTRLIVDQHAALDRLAGEVGAVLRFVKPHGALYNQAQVQESVARGVVTAVRSLDLPVLGQPGGVLERLAREENLVFVAEGFPDRRYTADGQLVPRSAPDAVLLDPAEVEAQVVRLVAEGLRTLCIHGDDPGAVRNAEVVRAALERHAIAVRFWAAQDEP